jgi:hypothetical protein
LLERELLFGQRQFVLHDLIKLREQFHCEIAPLMSSFFA